MKQKNRKRRMSRCSSGLSRWFFKDESRWFFKDESLQPCGGGGKSLQVQHFDVGYVSLLHHLAFIDDGNGVRAVHGGVGLRAYSVGPEGQAAGDFMERTVSTLD
jgi:hypothetical protein